MGYYIHSCLKMRYKGTYKPQHVLDFESFEWSPLDENMSRLMDKRKWVSMSRERSGGGEAADPAESQPSTQHPDPTPTTPTTEATDASPSLYPPPKFPIPAEAANSYLSLLELGMPGTLSLQQLQESVDLDDVRISLGKGGIHRTVDIVTWEDGNELDSGSVKGVIAEFAACLGPELVKGIVVDFAR